MLVAIVLIIFYINIFPRSRVLYFSQKMQAILLKWEKRFEFTLLSGIQVKQFEIALMHAHKRTYRFHCS